MICYHFNTILYHNEYDFILINVVNRYASKMLGITY